MRIRSAHTVIKCPPFRTCMFILQILSIHVRFVFFYWNSFIHVDLHNTRWCHFDTLVCVEPPTLMIPHNCCKLSPSTIPRLWNLVQNFNFSCSSTGFPNLAWKRAIFFGTGKIFHFLSAEIPVLSAEFPFLECSISIFWVQNSKHSVLEPHCSFECKIYIFWKCRISILLREICILWAQNSGRSN